MKSFFKIQIALSVLSLFFSCNNAERKGLLENERNYVKISTAINCEEIKHYPGDLLIKLETIDIDAIATRVISASDSLLGKGFTNNNIKDKIETHFFPFEKKIKENILIIDKINLWEIKNKKAYFDNTVTTPIQFNWKKLLHAGTNSLIIQDKIDDWVITHEVNICINPNWKQIGQFKRISKSESRVTIIPYYGYKMDVNIIYNLNVKNTSNDKLENYQVQLKESCTGFSVADLEIYLFQDGLLKSSDLKNEHKKIVIMREITY